MRKNLVYILDYVRVLFKRIFCVPTLSRLTTPERWKEGISFLKILLCKKGSFPLLRISVYLFVIYISHKVKKYILYTFHPICRLDEPFIVSNILYTFLHLFNCVPFYTWCTFSSFSFVSFVLYDQKYVCTFCILFFTHLVCFLLHCNNVGNVYYLNCV